MKKKYLILPILTGLLLVSSCNGTSNNPTSLEKPTEVPSISVVEPGIKDETQRAAISEELKGCFNYFQNTTNHNEKSPAYGLVLDRFTNRKAVSIAATGFSIGSYPVFIKEGLISESKAKKIVLGTLKTIKNMQENPSVSYGGCLAHFVSFDNAQRLNNSEISTIDTALLLSGIIVASEYFQDPEITELTNIIWGNVDYNAFKVTVRGKEAISMGVSDPKNPSSQIGDWSGFAEHLAIYLLGAGNPNHEHRLDGQIYKNMTKNYGTYGGYEYIYGWFGSLFVHQFPNAFFNFEDYVDEDGTNWDENSRLATLAARQYCIDYQDYYKTYGENSWGLTACDTPKGYSGHLGTPPKGYQINENDALIMGTVAPCAALGSAKFAPDEVMGALQYFQSNSKINNKKFGLVDAFNLDWNGKEWYCPDYIGIDKGISAIMLGNAKYGNLFSDLGGQNEYIKEAFEINGFKKIDK